MGAAVEADGDLGFGDGDIGGHIDQIAEDLPGLGVAVAPHSAPDKAVKPGSKNEERHIEINLEPH